MEKFKIISNIIVGEKGEIQIDENLLSDFGLTPGKEILLEVDKNIINIKDLGV